MPPYPPEAMSHLAAPAGAGGLSRPDCSGEAGAVACGDAVRVDLRVGSGRILDAGFLALGCGAATAAASAACTRLAGAPVRDALRLSKHDLDRDLGGLGAARHHGPELVEDAVSRALEAWFSSRLGGVGLPAQRDRVAVAMSGGVDSAVAALMLRDAGYDVVGVTMRLWHDPAAAAAERSCCSPDTIRQARACAHSLGLPHLVIDAEEQFRRSVVEAFAQGYRAGRTPNPCVTCNGEVRFAVLAQAAALLGARWMATGHYARIVGAGSGTAVATARDAGKDQSYMLSRLRPDTLRRVLLPLGGLTKAQARRVAADARLPAASAVESQDVCFVGVGGYVPFLERAFGMGPRPGPIVDQAGRRVGIHQGYWRYTVGQRRGVGVAVGGPLYVLATHADTNTVVVGPREALAAWSIRLEQMVAGEDLSGQHVDVRVRYRGRALRGRLSGSVVDLDDPTDGVAAGQTAVIYRDGRVVASGTISGARAPHVDRRGANGH